MTVHDSVTDLHGYGFYPLDIADGVALSKIDTWQLSATWRTARVGRVECRAIGEAWRARRESVGRIVPSAVVPEAFTLDDFTIALDPTHADFGAW